MTPNELAQIAETNALAGAAMNDIVLASQQVLRDRSQFMEHNDCAVVATANVLGVPYGDAHTLLARHGRRPRRGTKTSVAVAALQSRAQIKERDDLIRDYNYRKYAVLPTLAQFLRRLPKTGRFFICASHHGMAYVDGQLLDNLQRSKMRGRVYRCVEVILPTPPPAPKSDLTVEDIRSMMARLDALEAQLKPSTK